MIQLQGSPVTPLNSNSSSSSDPNARVLSEEHDSGTKTAYYGGGQEFLGAVMNSLLSNYTVFLFSNELFQ